MTEVDKVGTYSPKNKLKSNNEILGAMVENGNVELRLLNDIPLLWLGLLL